MSEKVFFASIKRKPGYFYFINKDLNIVCSPMYPKQVKNPSERIVAKSGLVLEENHIYFIDNDGDISRTKIRKTV